MPQPRPKESLYDQRQNPRARTPWWRCPCWSISPAHVGEGPSHGQQTPYENGILTLSIDISDVLLRNPRNKHIDELESLGDILHHLSKICIRSDYVLVLDRHPLPRILGQVMLQIPGVVRHETIPPRILFKGSHAILATGHFGGTLISHSFQEPFVITQSFICLDRIGHESERKIWQQGIHTWDDFLTSSTIKGMSAARKTMYSLFLQKAQKNLEVRNFPFFAEQFPFSEHWRLFETFKDDVVYLDIETTGLYGDITVLGLYDGENTKSLVKGKNLSKDLFMRALEGKKMIVSFNGSSFDVPIIERYFRVHLDMPHVDLRHVCAKVGLTGGLKSIERQVGIARESDLDGVSGLDAVYLWQAYKNGSQEALEKLVRYNEADIVNLVPLAELSIKKLWEAQRSTIRTDKEAYEAQFTSSTRTFD